MRSVFATVYLMWGIMWGVVMWHYYRASHSSWVEQEGKYREILKDFWEPIGFAYKSAWNGWVFTFKVLKYRMLNGHYPKAPGAQVMPTRYTVGHYLRFSIFVASIAPAALGTLFFSFDRTGMIRWVMLVNLTVVLLSLVGAAGHLFIAYNTRPASWTMYVIISTIWATVSPFVFYFYGWP